MSITFPRIDVRRVPDHWRTFGTRKSPLSGSPRLPEHKVIDLAVRRLFPSEAVLRLDRAIPPGIESFREVLAYANVGYLAINCECIDTSKGEVTWDSELAELPRTILVQGKTP